MKSLTATQAKKMADSRHTLKTILAMIEAKAMSGDYSLEVSTHYYGQFQNDLTDLDYNVIPGSLTITIHW